MIHDKKGDIGSLAFLIIMAMMVAISFFAGYTIWDKYNEKLDETGLKQDYPKLNETNTAMDRSFNILDLVWIIFFFGFFIAIMASAAQIDTSPWYVIGFVLVFLIILAIGFFISDTTVTIMETNGLVSAKPAFPMTYHVMNYLPFYLMGFMLLMAIIMYGVKRNE